MKTSALPSRQFRIVPQLIADEIATDVIPQHPEDAHRRGPRDAEPFLRVLSAPQPSLVPVWPRLGDSLVAGFQLKASDAFPAINQCR